MSEQQQAVETAAPGLMQPRCPYCGWTAVARTHDTAGVQAAMVDVREHRTACPARARGVRFLGDDLRDAVLALVDEWEQISGSDARAVEQWYDAAAWLKRTVERVYPPGAQS